MEETVNKPLLVTLMLAVFLDIGNFFMPMPIYTPLFLHSALTQGFSHEAKIIMLGSLVACFGLVQLFSGPLFGDLSDQYGRKKILLLSLAISFLGCMLSAVSLTINSLILIYVGRCLIGLGSGTIAVVFAFTSSHSTDNDRAKNLGYVNIGVALGVAFGAAIGGHLASIRIASFHSYAIPFYFMSILYLATMLLIFKLLHEEGPLREKSKTHVFSSFITICRTMKHSRLLSRLILTALLFQIGTESFYLAAPIYCVKVLHMLPATIANHFFLQGIMAAITCSWINKYLSNYFSSTIICLFSVLLLSIALLFLPVPKNSSMLYSIFFGVGIFATLYWIHINNLFSEVANKDEQGLIFGISQALWSIGGILGSLLTGFVTIIHFQFGVFLPTILEMTSLIVMLLILVERTQQYKRCN